MTLYSQNVRLPISLESFNDGIVEKYVLPCCVWVSDSVLLWEEAGIVVRVCMGIGILMLVEELLLFLSVTSLPVIAQFPIPSVLCTLRTG